MLPLRSNHLLQKGVSYRLDQTLSIPWMQDWHLASTFEFNGLVGAGDVWGKSSQQKSTGLLFDTTHAGICGNRIFILEVNACRVGACLMQGSHNNLVEAQWIHLTNLGIQLGDAGAPEVSGNRIIAGISGDIPHTSGVRVFGNRNSLWLDVLSADPERGLVLEEPAHDNLILSTGLAGGFTNKAKRPTNRLISPSAPETVATPDGSGFRPGSGQPQPRAGPGANPHLRQGPGMGPD